MARQQFIDAAKRHLKRAGNEFDGLVEDVLEAVFVERIAAEFGHGGLLAGACLVFHLDAAAAGDVARVDEQAAEG